MRLFTALKKNIVPILFIGVAAAILIYMTQRKDGFATCNATNCRSKGGSWIDNICYRPCSSIGRVVYQECITPIIESIHWQRGQDVCNHPENTRTINTFCANKLKTNENRAKNKRPRPTFSSC